MNQVDISHSLTMFLAICTNLRNCCPQNERTSSVRLGRAFGYIFALEQVGLITIDQGSFLAQLAISAQSHQGKPFPSRHNAGPQMPPSVWLARTYPVQVEIEQAPANEVDGMTIQSVLGLPGEGMTLEGITQVPAPAPRRELRLLCLLVENGGFSRTYPPQTLRSVPPRVDHSSKWGGSNLPGLFMRETYAIAPAPEVLARLQRHGQTRSVCAYESPRRHCATV